MQSAQPERTLTEGIIYYLSVLRRYSLFIILTTAIAGIGAVAFAFISLDLPPEKSPMPNTYRAYATLVVQRDQDSSITTLMASLGLPVDTRAGLDYGQMAIKIIESRSFQDTLVEHFDLVARYEITENVKTNSRNIIRNGMELIYDRVTGTLTIAYTHIDPVFSRDVVNLTVEFIQDWFSQRGSTTKERQTELVAIKLQDVTQEMNNLEEQIESFQKKYGVLRVEELATRQMDLLSNLQSQLVLKEMEINTHQQFSRIQDPELIRLKAERTNLVRLIREMEDGVSTDARGALPGNRELPELSRYFNKLNTDLQIQQRIYQSLSQQLEILKLDVASEPVFQVLELAEVPDEKAGPQRGRMVAMITITTFLMSVMLAIMINSLKKVKIEHETRK